MKRLKAFYYIYKNSLYNIRYYKDILKVEINFSLKYFFTLAAIATVVTTIRVAAPLIPTVKTTLNNLVFELSTVYPKDLVITAKDGEWTINQEEPYAIGTPEFLKDSDKEKIEAMIDEAKGDVDDDFGGFPKNLIIFDHQGTINDLRDKDTLILVNEANLITINSQGSLEVHPIDTIPNGELTKQRVDQALGNVKKYLGFVPALIILFVLLGTLVYFTLFRLGYAIVLALIFLAVGNIKQLKYDFSHYYKIALHSITLPLTLELAFTLIGMSIVTLPFSFMVLHIIFGTIIVVHLADTGAKAGSKK